ncbi:saccharopine dehydrogenase family protein [Streptomyces sp. NPDC093591]|uniref:saccharopine dehydrogenase family protein n=1 Tax=Streptomyces sp. NPDC093591 TaxID=3366044 RepID=UPI00380E2590
MTARGEGDRDRSDEQVDAAGRGPIVVLGAAGAVGLALAQDLVSTGGLRLRLVDIDVTTLRGLAGDDVEVIEADVLQPGRAAEVLDGASLLVNCLSFVLFDQVFAMAIDAGIDYTDLISEPSEQQAAQAAARGITAVPGLGLSPGLSNILVGHAARSMRVEEVEILFALFRTMAASRGALDTMLWEGAEYSPGRTYYLDGKHVPAGPFDGARVVDFGGAFGQLEVYYRPHPEPTSLPRNFPSIRFAAVRGTWQPEVMNDLRVLNKYGLLSKENLPLTAEIIWERLGGIESPLYHGQSAGMTEVRGTTADGERIVRTYRTARSEDLHAYALTGRCAAVGVRLMAAHGRVRTGVVDPEAYFDPDEFLAALREQGLFDVSWTDEPWVADRKRPLGADPAPLGPKGQ